MPEVYVSTDIEADGPIPGPHSMLSFASAAYARDKTLIGTFSANLELLPGAAGDPGTMRWWEQHPEAWAAARESPRGPAEAMPDYVRWLKSLPGKPIFVAYPAGFDFMFVTWYLHRFAGESPFSFSALDVKTYAMALLGGEFRNAVKRAMPRAWFDDMPHTHVALDDALEQGAMFCNMLAARDRHLAGGLTLRDYRPGDEAELIELFRETIRRVNRRHYGPEQIAAWAPDDIDAAAWRRRQADGRRVIVAEVGGEAVGYGEVEADGHIHHFFVHHGWQGRGVGRRILARIEEAAEPRRLFVEASITARPFFERHGYRVIEEQLVEVRGQKLTNFRMEKRRPEVGKQ